MKIQFRVALICKRAQIYFWNRLIYMIITIGWSVWMIVSLREFLLNWNSVEGVPIEDLRKDYKIQIGCEAFTIFYWLMALCSECDFKSSINT